MRIEGNRRRLWPAKCFALALVLGSCAAPNPVGKIREIAITKVHPGGGGDCRDWVVTEASVRDFFAHAVSISGPEHHHHYYVYPCWAAGTFVAGLETWKWELNGGGAAYVFPPNRERFIVADPKMREVPE